jgi:RHS repeat-associated protein
MSQGIAFLQPVEYPVYNTGNNMVTYKRDTIRDSFWDDHVVWSKHFTLCDHLGSVAKEITPNYDVKAMNSYTPFGKTLTLIDGDVRTKYIGKETDYETSLADHGVRKYDAGIGRFTCPDVLWGKYAGWSPYHYCGNNPVSAVDGNGYAIDVIADVAFIIYDVYDIAATALSGKDVSGTQWVALGADVGGALIPCATGAGIAVRAASHTDDVARGAKALSKFTHAATYGFDSYKNLRKAVGKNSGLHVHHLIESRFANTMGEFSANMKSIVLTTEEHAKFTKAWRDAIGYSTDTKAKFTTYEVSKEQVLDAAKKVYQEYPEILKELGL